ncbi:MAG: hypothetical protein E5W38_17710 [Mesorhizobium sp.]|uniref:hypothetical protein n=1 Tax=unclassified Mesorhizobium TaxID=325217 RepID=UPI000F75F7FD|nr:MULTISPECIES: hypothetical protein [unclassified Mesorhizobium]AZO24284.1 hypothetical protein EJ070_28735 [Mesorhizobium sp. M1E.F.Ca.ET.045.02.1.1]RUW82481.1 hypothetical protein EOA29_17345 [Mesorhizobium sp. M1E.F.Ca.ET.063.01.1.1]RWB54772.1 MAG: hypothetical protein EOQ47_17520 [Mesorhizobium sp.]TIU30920.1 MAG: hypothetical protein E5W38_17710 [Mesorhizobium sp.]TKB21931.1 MAG: hypothetical protein E5V75_02095 [Mesorhizobium sp.]
MTTNTVRELIVGFDLKPMMIIISQDANVSSRRNIGRQSHVDQLPKADFASARTGTSRLRTY